MSIIWRNKVSHRFYCRCCCCWWWLVLSMFWWDFVSSMYKSFWLFISTFIIYFVFIHSLINSVGFFLGSLKTQVYISFFSSSQFCLKWTIFKFKRKFVCFVAVFVVVVVAVEHNFVSTEQYQPLIVF